MINNNFCCLHIFPSLSHIFVHFFLLLQNFGSVRLLPNFWPIHVCNQLLFKAGLNCGFITVTGGISWTCCINFIFEIEH